jgi:hypothetical protein
VSAAPLAAAIKDGLCWGYFSDVTAEKLAASMQTCANALGSTAFAVSLQLLKGQCTVEVGAGRIGARRSKGRSDREHLEAGAGRVEDVPEGAQAVVLPVGWTRSKARPRREHARPIRLEMVYLSAKGRGAGRRLHPRSAALSRDP